MKGEAIRILLAEPNPEIRKAVFRILRGMRHVEFGCIAGGVAPILTRIRRFRPDLLLIDAGLVSLDGFALLHRLRETAAPARIVLLTIHDGEELRALAARASSDACISKSRLGQELGPELDRLFRIAPACT